MLSWLLMLLLMLRLLVRVLLNWWLRLRLEGVNLRLKEGLLLRLLIHLRLRKLLELRKLRRVLRVHCEQWLGLRLSDERSRLSKRCRLSGSDFK